MPTCEVSDPAVIDVSRLAVALPAVSVAKVNVSRLAGRSPGYSVPAKITESFQASEHRKGGKGGTPNPGPKKKENAVVFPLIGRRERTGNEKS